MVFAHLLDLFHGLARSKVCEPLAFAHSAMKEKNVYSEKLRSRQ
jgi:hypothetical protein